MDDSVLYTGTDGPIGADGIFGNEIVEASVKEAIDDQKRLLSELTPQLEDIITMLDAERALAIQFIADYVDTTKDTDDVMRGELKAAARYRNYLDGLKTKFQLALNKTRGQ